MTNEDLWKATLGEIELTISKPQFITWFKETSILSNENGNIVISVPNGFTKEWLENKFNKEIIKTLRNFQSDIQQITCIISGSKKNIDGATNSPQKNNTINLKNNNVSKNFQTETSFNNLNPKYTFDSFIVGKNNELAKAACLAVLKNPGTQYNPLFIYGDVGLGKTHLLQSIGNEIIKNNTNKKVIYISTEDFTSEFVNSLQTGIIDQFKRKYQQIDLLLIDDIQFISGKNKTQDIFFHIFNFLYQLNKQIVLSSDRPPNNIKILEDRLKSRFEGGMITDINSPELETRIAILESKLKQRDFYLDTNILEYIAVNIKNNVRELEGALNKIIATCELENKEPTLLSVKNILSGIISSKQKVGVNHKDIIIGVANFFEIKKDSLFKKTRKKKIAIPRQIAMFLIREELNMSYPEIGDCFGGRDHTTALHAYKKIKNEIKDNIKLKNNISHLKDIIFNC